MMVLDDIIILKFYDCKNEPENDARVLFWSCGNLFTGAYFDGHFYNNGSIYFPDSWCYEPKEPNLK